MKDNTRIFLRPLLTCRASSTRRGGVVFMCSWLHSSLPTHPHTPHPAVPVLLRALWSSHQAGTHCKISKEVWSCNDLRGEKNKLCKSQRTKLCAAVEWKEKKDEAAGGSWCAWYFPSVPLVLCFSRFLCLFLCLLLLVFLRSPRLSKLLQHCRLYLWCLPQG